MASLSDLFSRTAVDPLLTSKKPWLPTPPSLPPLQSLATAFPPVPPIEPATERLGGGAATYDDQGRPLTADLLGKAVSVDPVERNLKALVGAEPPDPNMPDWMKALQFASQFEAGMPMVGMARGPRLLTGATKTGRAATKDLSSIDFVGPPPAAAPAVEPKTLSSVFDYSRLNEVPKVPQFELPRYDPPRGVSARVQDLINDPVLRDKMLETLQAGIKKGGPAWYNTEQLLEPFQSVLGKEKGAAAYRKFLDYVAASSTRSEVGVNVRNASYYYNLWKNGLPMPEVGSPMPQPYGHMAQMQHQRNAIDVAGAGWDPLKTPKSSSFVEDLAGNQRPVAVDAHATKLPPMLKQDPRWLAGSVKLGKDLPTINPAEMFKRGELSMDDALKRPAFWVGEPNANEYGALEKYWQGLGQDVGLTPAQGQGSGWVGGGHITGLKSDANIPFLRFVDDRLHITAERLGVPPETVLKDFIKGKTTLFGLGGAAIGFAALPPDQQKALVERAGSPDPGGA